MPATATPARSTDAEPFTYTELEGFLHDVVVAMDALGEVAWNDPRLTVLEQRMDRIIEAQDAIRGTDLDDRLGPSALAR